MMWVAPERGSVELAGGDMDDASGGRWARCAVHKSRRLGSGRVTVILLQARGTYPANLPSNLVFAARSRDDHVCSQLVP